MPMFIDDPTPILPVLEALRGDPEEYVRRSVANNLNDIAKDHPDTVASIAESWLKGSTVDQKRRFYLGTKPLIKRITFWEQTSRRHMVRCIYGRITRRGKRCFSVESDGINQQLKRHRLGFLAGKMFFPFDELLCCGSAVKGMLCQRPLGRPPFARWPKAVSHSLLKKPNILKFGVALPNGIPPDVQQFCSVPLA